MWKKQFDELIPKNIDILQGGNKVLCSRQAVINFISDLIKEIRDDVVGNEKEMPNIMWSPNDEEKYNIGYNSKRLKDIDKFNKYLN